ncbi:MAG: hypothetical protein EAZ09_19070 [Oscillatoriales cyanobacterium]|nr:MAG: hypothetical protein EAZ18_22220 [Oscillatoriales cyanobacterium]TAH17928.1 MAG: hypothetical protein EAZ09_19070 [Oscillatoriales cyanobacterium]
MTVNTKNSKYIKFWINFCGLKVGVQSKDNLKSKPDRWKYLEPVAVNLWKNDRATASQKSAKYWPQHKLAAVPGINFCQIN